MSHPNAATAGTSSGFALFLVWLAGHFGVADLGAEEAVVFTGLLASVALLIGRKGVHGIMHTLWRGNESTP